ncbi:MAG: S1C family serine protease [Steroidobacteraceae bacterium]
MLVAASVLVSLAAVALYSMLSPAPRPLTQRDIDGAVKYTLARIPRAPSDSARAAAVIAPSVVEVEGFLSPAHAAALSKAAGRAAAREHRTDRHGSKHSRRDHHARAAPPVTTGPSSGPEPDAIGSGVVVNASGDILTALHVVSGTDRWIVVFADGSKSAADFVGSQPKNDIAVLQARRVPKAARPAVLASSAGLAPGDEVVATGFPFGIGPTVTAGVVSGLDRDFVDPEDDHTKLSHLIQFDAAVNPGNSGGPLVNRDGEVVGIVDAILDPSGAHTFDGIGFAVPIESAARAAGDNPL